MPGGMPDDIVALLAGIPGVEQASLVETAALRLVESVNAEGEIADDPADGFVIPLDGARFEAAEAARLFSPELADALAAVPPGSVVLSEASAALRRLGPGGTITFEDGTTVEVSVVLPTEIVGSSEIVFVGDQPLPASSGEMRQVAVVAYDGPVRELEAALAPLLTDGPFRLFGGNETDGPGSAINGAGAEGAGPPRVRAVLPQLTVKQEFGEFAYRPSSGGAIVIDPAWLEANIVTVEIPLLGSTRCHRHYAEILIEVMQGLVDDGLEDIIDPGAFRGCWNPRFIGGTNRLSRHAWGIAADINFLNPLDGEPGSPIHPELLARMEAAGVTSGHRWTSPDPGHFEYVGSG